MAGSKCDWIRTEIHGPFLALEPAGTSDPGNHRAANCCSNTLKANAALARQGIRQSTVKGSRCRQRVRDNARTLCISSQRVEGIFLVEIKDKGVGITNADSRVGVANVSAKRCGTMNQNAGTRFDVDPRLSNL